MLGFRFGRWVHAAIAGGSLTMTGCVERLVVDPSLIGQQPTTGFETETETSPSDGTDSSNPSDPSVPTVNPSDPTTDPTQPTDPTTDPTDPTDPTQGNVNGPPQLIDVRLVNATTLELQFNEAMGAPSEVDVSAFRLSVGFANYYSGKYDYSGTQYQYLQAFTGEEVCQEYCYCDDYYDEYCEDDYCDYNCYTQPGPPVDLVSLSQVPGTQHRWFAQVSTPIDGVCGAVRNIEEGWDEGGMFLHYSNNNFPGVLDAQGEALAPIAEHWVLAPGQNFAYRSGYFESMDPFIPIDCPF